MLALKEQATWQGTEDLRPPAQEELSPANNDEFGSRPYPLERWSASADNLFSARERPLGGQVFRWEPGPGWHFDYSLMGDLELRIQLVKVKVLSCSVVSNFVTPWTVACQARILEWAAILFSRGSSLPRDRTWVSCLLHCRFFTVWATREAQLSCTQIPELQNLWDNKYVLF